ARLHAGRVSHPPPRGQAVRALRPHGREDGRCRARDVHLPAVSAGPARQARSQPVSLPDGFTVGHWSDKEAATGCTVLLPPAEGAVASGEVRGGGPGTRELDLLDPLANAARVHGILLTGGSAFGLAAADGVVRWLERAGRGYETPGGLVPLVPAAVVYDLVSGDPRRRPGPAEGEAACEA